MIRTKWVLRCTYPTKTRHRCYKFLNLQCQYFIASDTTVILLDQLVINLGLHRIGCFNKLMPTMPPMATLKWNTTVIRQFPYPTTRYGSLFSRILSRRMAKPYSSIWPPKTMLGNIINRSIDYEWVSGINTTYPTHHLYTVNVSLLGED